MKKKSSISRRRTQRMAGGDTRAQKVFDLSAHGISMYNSETGQVESTNVYLMDPKKQKKLCIIGEGYYSRKRGEVGFSMPDFEIEKGGEGSPWSRMVETLEAEGSRLGEAWRPDYVPATTKAQLKYYLRRGGRDIEFPQLSETVETRELEWHNTHSGETSVRKFDKYTLSDQFVVEVIWPDQPESMTSPRPGFAAPPDKPEGAEELLSLETLGQVASASSGAVTPKR